MKRISAGAVSALIFLISACNDESIMGVDPQDVEASFSVAEADVEGPGLFGPETFRRGRRPRTEVREFSIAGFEPPFTLYLQNGDDRGRRKVTRGRVVLNGTPMTVGKRRKPPEEVRLSRYVHRTFGW